jgi:hypothetical protein
LPVRKAISNAATAATRQAHRSCRRECSKAVRRGAFYCKAGCGVGGPTQQGPIADNSYGSQQRQRITSVWCAQTCSKLLHDANHQNSSHGASRSSEIPQHQKYSSVGESA